MNDYLLTWGLVICTYKREKILPICLELAVQQTRKPLEIIVVDTSPNWEETKAKILTQLAKDHPGVRWVYTTGKQPSITIQRNIGIQLATADVVFLIDDDSLMYPDCAEEVMKVYEADREEKIKGVKASRVTFPPSHPDLEINSKDIEKSLKLSSHNSLFRFLFKHLFLMDAEKLFIPYDGDYPDYPIPQSLLDLDIKPMRLFTGCEMTFRRESVLKEKFESLLLYYAAGEDLDASYRVSRQGSLVQAMKGKLCHIQSPGGRLSSLQSIAFSALNLALLLKKNSNNLNRDQKLFSSLMKKRLLAEFFKDFLTGRWQFPQVRGILLAMKHSQEIFTISDDNLAHWYPQFQKDFLAQ